MLWSQDDRWLVIGARDVIYALEPESVSTLVRLIEGKGLSLVGVIPETGK